jgi:hypothetical protein
VHVAGAAPSDFVVENRKDASLPRFEMSGVGPDSHDECGKWLSAFASLRSGVVAVEKPKVRQEAVVKRIGASLCANSAC